MKKTDRSLGQVKLIYIYTTIFLIALSIYTFVQIKSLIDSSDLINHTNLVNQTLQKISIFTLESETNKRSYFLTGDSSLLQMRDIALDCLLVQVTLLEGLLNDNPSQVESLKRLKKAIREKIISVKHLVPEKNKLNTDSLIKINTIEGIRKMEIVNHEINYIMKVETYLFKIRTQKYNWDLFLTPFFIITLFLGAILILLFSYFRLNATLNHAWSLQKELAFQNTEKEKRAMELITANEELAFQNDEKEKRAMELILANKELAFQNTEKEKRTMELDVMNKELQLFAHISSHDLQEPLRKLQISASRIAEKDVNNLSEKGKEYFKRMQDAALSMETLIDDLINYARANNKEVTFENVHLNDIIQEAINGLKERIDSKEAIIEVSGDCEVHVIPFQIRQLLHNLIGNALKFSKPNVSPHIFIKSIIKKGNEFHIEKLLPQTLYCHISVSDNGIGFAPEYNERIFEVFQRLHGKEKFKGTGIGLAIAKKIVENHQGIIIPSSQLDEGATFDIFFPSQINTNIHE